MTDNIPSIRIFELPKKERSAAESIVNNLRQLNSYIERFVSALELREFCELYAQRHPELERTIMNWRLIAFRDGGMSIWHFSRIMHGIGVHLRDAPTVARSMDVAKKKKATSNFVRDFPNAVWMRHAIAHEAEKFAIPKEVAKNAIKGSIEPVPGLKLSGDQLVIGAIVVGTKFHSNFKRRLISFDLDRISQGKLIAIKDLYYSAFESSDR